MFHHSSFYLIKLLTFISGGKSPGETSGGKCPTPHTYISYIHTYMYIHTYIHTYIHVHTYIHMYINTYIHSSIQYVHTYIYIPTHLVAYFLLLSCLKKQ